MRICISASAFYSLAHFFMRAYSVTALRKLDYLNIISNVRRPDWCNMKTLIAIVMSIALWSSAKAEAPSVKIASYCLGFAAAYASNMPSAVDCEGTPERCNSVDAAFAPAREKWLNLATIWAQRAERIEELDDQQSVQYGILGTNDGRSLAVMILTEGEKLRNIADSDREVNYLIDMSSVCSSPLME